MRSEQEINGRIIEYQKVLDSIKKEWLRILNEKRETTEDRENFHNRVGQLARNLAHYQTCINQLKWVLAE